MEVFRRLIVRADAVTVGTMVDQIEHGMPSGWTLDREATAKTLRFRPNPTFCFSCTREGQRHAAELFLSQKDEGTYHVSNIFPIERHQLSCGEYNTILEDFYKRVFQPYAELAGLDYTLTGAVAGLKDWMTEQTAEKLHQFSFAANTGTGASLTRDRERWNDFVLSAHQEKCDLDASTLQRWLTEVEGWAPEVADLLAMEYEYGRELLAFAESRRSA